MDKCRKEEYSKKKVNTMDDLLIVRMSEHSKARTARARRHGNQAAIGMNLGLITGVGLGLSFTSIHSSEPAIGMIIGLAIGLAIGGLFGKLITPKRRPKPTKKHYTGFDIAPEETEEEKTNLGEDLSND
tara:strand:- start:1279 stop:1665 length:387 start_codon:yes stop_codon:yes gene_type:complete